MKKFFAFFNVFLLVFTSFAVSADEGKYQTAGDLYQAWCDDLPDYICGVWSVDGGMSRLNFAVQDTEEGNAGKQEILDLVMLDDTVSFSYQKYSRNYLVQIRDELYEYFIKDIGLIYAGLNETDNRIDLGIYYKRKDDSETKEMISELTAKYGDAVAFEYSDLIYTTDLTVPIDGVPVVTYTERYTFPVFLGIVILSATLYLAVRRKKAAVLVTNMEGAVTHQRAFTLEEVERAVKESAVPFPPQMDATVMEKIERISEIR